MNIYHLCIFDNYIFSFMGFYQKINIKTALIFYNYKF